MTRRKTPAPTPVDMPVEQAKAEPIDMPVEQAKAEPIEEGFPIKDHPDQAVDTPLPGDTVNEEVWAAMAAEYEGDPEDEEEEAKDG